MDPRSGWGRTWTPSWWGGELVADRLLIHALSHDEPEYRFAAASALLASGERARRDVAVDALVTAGGPALAALGRAFALHPSVETTEALLERWPALPARRVSGGPGGLLSHWR